jgi:hypothetical protein
MLDIKFEFAFEFIWERPQKRKGFAWEESDTGETHLVRVADAPFEGYEPLKECTGLFRTFADLSTDAAAMLDFANRYGPLGGRWDDLLSWKEAIVQMNFVVTVWEALATENWTRLRSFLSKIPAEMMFRPKIDAKRASDGELVNACVYLLYHEVASRTFAWIFGDLPHLPTMPVTLWHSQAKRLVLKLSPPSLLHAMYLQLANAIRGNKRYQQCEACGRWFELAPGLNRSDRQTCSDSCRVKLYRIRQQRAKELHSKRWSLKRISKKLGSDISTIKKWLSQNKE